MVNLIHRIIYGTLMGLGISLLLWVLVFEYMTFYVITPLFPLVGFLMGLTFACLGRIEPRRVWVSLLIFTILVSLSISYSKLRGLILRLQREHVAIELSEIYPGSRIIEKEYGVGNGMEEVPKVEVIIEGDGNYKEIVEFYNKRLKELGWKYSSPISSTTWRKNNYEVFLRRIDKDLEGKTFYELNIYFYVYWMTHFRGI